MRRSDQRREAAFAIYQHDVTGRPLEDLLAGAKPFTRALVEGTLEEVELLDAEIGAHAHGWAISRIAPLEKAIMRVALYEIRNREDVPTPVAIDEAVSIVARYCGAEAPRFVNGVLSAAAKTLAASTTASAAVDATPAASAATSAAPVGRLINGNPGRRRRGGGRLSAADARKRLAEAADRLDQISTRLREETTPDAEAVGLATEAAELAAEVGSLAAEAARAVSQGAEQG